MKPFPVLVAITLLLSGCATSSSRWEVAALGASLADIGSTGNGLESGFREANPIYGENPSVEKMLAVNLGMYAGVWYMTRNSDDVVKQRNWRTFTLIRLLAAGWNLSQTGCACFKFSF